MMVLAYFSHYFFGITMFLTALFLIMLVLIQRGRGGGLSGAFGGMGGQSAFGTRAGDTFTWVTIYASAAWIVLCICAVKFMNFEPTRFDTQQATQTTLPGSLPDGDSTLSDVPLPTDSTATPIESGLGSDPGGASGALPTASTGDSATNAETANESGDENPGDASP